MKWCALAMVILLGYLQYRLWLAEGGTADLTQLEAQIADQRAENARLSARNRLLAAQVQALKEEGGAVEERARTDLGMIKSGETFIMVVPEQSHNK